MKKTFIFAALIATSLSATVAQAATPSFYGSASVTQSHLNVGNISGIDRDATGYTLSAGADFNSTFGVEASYSDFGKRSAFGADLDATAVGVYGVVKYPVTKAVTLFAKPGVVQTKAEVAGVSEHKNNVALGLGASYAVNDRVSVQAEFNHLRNFANQDTFVNTWSTGVKVGF